MSNIKKSGRAAAGGGRAGRTARGLLVCLLLPAGCLLLSGCRQDMQDTPRHEAYEAGSEKFSENGAASRTLVEGTVARGHLREDALFYTGRAAGAGATAQGSTTTTAAAAMTGPDLFPIAIDEAALRRGRDRFDAFCAMCHGGAGDGDGMIPRRGFQRPPSFHEDRLQEGSADAAHFFDVITNGWGAMPAYAYMIPPEDRWKIIAYVRALQLSRRLNQNELSEQERARVAAGSAERRESEVLDYQNPGYGGRARPEVEEERHR
jgi:mono/diheme cytochrome c family protein